MFLAIFKFELRYWLRQPMPYIFLLLNALFILGAMSSDNVTVGSAVGNVHRNAPAVVQQFYFAFSMLFGLLMTTSFVQNAALRDFNYNTAQIVFASPIRKFDYLAGRFLGAVCIAMVPFLGLLLGEILAKNIAPALNWMPAERFGAINFMAHVNGFLTAVLPNVFFVGAVIFGIAAVTRSTMLSFIGALGLLVGYGISASMLRDLQNENLAALADPFGIRAFALATKYWAVAERNSMSVGFENLVLLGSRLLWMAVGAAIALLTFWRFSFTERKAWKFWSRKDAKTQSVDKEGFASLRLGVTTLPAARQTFGLRSQLLQLWSETKANFQYMTTGTAFIVLLIFGLLNQFFSLKFASAGFYGLKTEPVTYDIIETIRGSMNLFMIAIVVFYSGQLVWREREAKMDGIHDATPHATGISVFSKLLAVLGGTVLMQLLSIGMGIATQSLHGFSRHDWPQFFFEFLVADLGGILALTALSMLIQAIFNQKYLAFFVFVAFVVLNSFIWSVLDWPSHLVEFDGNPSKMFSDMNRYGSALAAYLWFRGHWFLMSALIATFACIFWLRGSDFAWKNRLRAARERFSGGLRVATIGLAGAALCTGGWIFYNTKILNKIISSDQQEAMQVDYEKLFKKYENTPQPKIVDAAWDIQLAPETRSLRAMGDLVLVNKNARPLDSVLLTLPSDMTSVKVELAGAAAVFEDKRLHFSIFKFEKPLAVGDSVRLHFESIFEKRGFENEVSFTQMAENGTFFNTSDITPIIGYQPNGELSDKNKRKKHGLPERRRMPELCPSCLAERSKTYISNCSDWVTMRTRISTSPDQIAIAPGSLRREFSENGRRVFEYEVDRPSLLFGSFMSARYQVERSKWNGIDCEVYYDAQHPKNVPNMMNSLKKSLAYYTENFGPYFHKQARIIEFPRYASFAQAFPGTMPYSESIGFISEIDPESDIDMVFYVVAHEMGHQWWAHQVIGAEMQGATLLSETMAQYSALRVMEKEYGHDRMGKFLKYESDRYLRSRGSETEKECPLATVENQGYVHYRKGSAVLFQLTEIIGEQALNRALRNMVDSFAYRSAPYPTSRDLLDRFYANTPDSLKISVKSLFEEMIFWDNRTLSAVSRKLPDGKFEVEIEVSSARMKADSLGNETPAPLSEWLEIGALAKPEGERAEGKILARRKVKLAGPTGKFKLVTDEEPYEAGVDPLHYLIDRVPKDNLKRVTAE